MSIATRISATIQVIVITHITGHIVSTSEGHDVPRSSARLTFLWAGLDLVEGHKLHQTVVDKFQHFIDWRLFEKGIEFGVRLLLAYQAVGVLLANLVDLFAQHLGHS